MKITLQVNSSDANNIFASSYNVKTGLHTCYTLELNGLGVYDVFEDNCLRGSSVKTQLFAVARATSALGKLCQFLSDERGMKVSLTFPDGK